MAAEFGIGLTDRQINQFSVFYDMLIEKNKVMNLTSITEQNEVIIKHFADSLSLGKVIHFGVENVSRETFLCKSVPGNHDHISENSTGDKFIQKNKLEQTEEDRIKLPAICRVLDLGTGAGFPGIPLKIAYPSLSMVLADSLNKRIVFLQEVIDSLNMEDIQAIHGRAEELGKKGEYRENFDLCVSRAVANLAVLAEYCLPFVKIGGYFVSYKASHVEEELKQSKKALSVLGGQLNNVQKFMLPGTDIARTLIIIKKVKETGKKYPRIAGKPSKNPL